MTRPAPAARRQPGLFLTLGAVSVLLLGVSQPVLGQGLVKGMQEGAQAGNRAAGPVGGVLGGAIGGVVGVFNGALGVGGECAFLSGVERGGSAGAYGGSSPRAGEYCPMKPVPVATVRSIPIPR